MLCTVLSALAMEDGFVRSEQPRVMDSSRMAEITRLKDWHARYNALVNTLRDTKSPEAGILQRAVGRMADICRQMCYHVFVDAGVYCKEVIARLSYFHICAISMPEIIVKNCIFNF